MGNYNEFADKYASLTEALEAETRKRLYRLLPACLDGTVLLDVGCGSGQDAAYYASLGATVYGIDISQKEIEMAKVRAKGTFLTGTMDELPFEDDFFDHVTSLYALQTSRDVTEAIMEMLRVVKPGGTVNIVTKHPIRNLLEGYRNNSQRDYFNQGVVTSRIFGGQIILQEPGHTIEQYLNDRILTEAKLSRFSEHQDFPASDDTIMDLCYPTYMALQYTKHRAIQMRYATRISPRP